MQKNRLPPLMPERNPLTQREHAREVLWQITIPLVIGVVIVLALAVLSVVMLDEAEASLWADISLIFLLIPLMLVSLLLMALLSGVIYMLLRLLKVIPPYARKVQDFAYRIEQRARSGANAAAEPILRVNSVVAGYQALRLRLRRMTRG
jgi:hypothetical protein